MNRIAFRKMAPCLLSLLFIIGCNQKPAPDGGNGAESNQPDGKPKTGDQAKYAESDYRKLIDGLASPNKRPKLGEYAWSVHFPEGYDWETQKKIAENYAILHKHCQEALPLLVDFCEDERYSLTCSWSDGEYYISRSVGDVCQTIIANHIEVFRDSMEYIDPPEWHRYSYIYPLYHNAKDKQAEIRKQNIAEWWRERKKKSLRELQLEAFDWAIEKRSRDVEKKPDNDRLAEDVQRLTAARDALKRSSDCLPPLKLEPVILSPGSRQSIHQDEETEKEAP